MIDLAFDAVFPWLCAAGAFIACAKLVRYIARRIFWDR